MLLHTSSYVLFSCCLIFRDVHLYKQPHTCGCRVAAPTVAHHLHRSRRRPGHCGMRGSAPAPGMLRASSPALALCSGPCTQNMKCKVICYHKGPHARNAGVKGRALCPSKGSLRLQKPTRGKASLPTYALCVAMQSQHTTYGWQAASSDAPHSPQLLRLPTPHSF